MSLRTELIVLTLEFLALLVGGFLAHKECHVGFNAATLLAAIAAVLPALAAMLVLCFRPRDDIDRISVIFSLPQAMLYAALVTVAHALVGGRCDTVHSQVGLAFVLITFPLILTLIIMAFVIVVTAAAVGMPHLIAAAAAQSSAPAPSSPPAIVAPSTPTPAPDRAVSPVRAASPVRRRSSRSPRRRAH